MPHIIDVRHAFPAYYYRQEELLSELKKSWLAFFHNFHRVEQFHQNVHVDGRYMALPLSEYQNLKGLKTRNDHWQKTALELSTKMITELLVENDLSPSVIDILISNTVTGFSVPSIEAKVMNKILFRKNCKRLPLFGLGCLAGVAGLNHVHNYLIGHPKEAAIFFSNEFCSLTLQLDDTSMANIISSALFGDGSAAVLMVGDENPLREKSKFKISNPHSAFFPETEHIMGWDIVDNGLKVLLDPQVPHVVMKYVPQEMELFLNRLDMNEHPQFFVAHPGGPKVLTSLQSAFNLKEGDLVRSWETLKRVGNISSVSVLLVLEDFIRNPHPERFGMMMALGPAFCAEMNLLEKM